LDEYICRLSKQTSFYTCSDNLRLSAISCSPSTCSRIFYRVPRPRTPPPVAVGIDDFAYKKGISYGSVIVDLYSHKVIDVLDSRSAPAVTEWFDSHPTVQYVSRDGGLNFKNGIGDSIGCITQIRDRFHLLKDLSGYTGRAVKRFAASYKWDMQDISLNRDDVYREMWRHMYSSQRYDIRTKYERFVTFNEMISKGYKVREIAERLGVGTAVVHRHRHMQLRQNLRQEQMSLYRHLDDIVDGISGNSIKGARDISRAYPDIPESVLCGLDGRIGGLKMEALRKMQSCKKLKAPSDKEIFKVFFVRGYETRHEHFGKILQRNPVLRKAIQLCIDFRDMMNNEFTPRPLSLWIKEVRKLKIRELNDFVRMICLDREAVENAVDMPWSNGLLEGTVNKIKVIKRIVYGRASCKLLKLKLVGQNST
jgi:predicted transcriptional regulator